MKLRSSKLFLIFCGIIFLYSTASLVYLIHKVFFKEAESSKNTAFEKSIASSINWSDVVQYPSFFQKDSGGITSDTKDQDKEISEVERLIISDWLDQSGFNFIQTMDYRLQYTEEQLERLSESGDYTATDALTLIYRDDGRDAKPLAELSAVRGSLSGLSNLAHLNNLGLYILNPTAEEIREYYINALAYYRVMDLRQVGQILGGRVNIKLLKQYYNQSFPDAAFSESDEQEVLLRAGAIHADLLQKRHSLGLGDFEEPPEEVKKLAKYGFKY